MASEDDKTVGGSLLTVRRQQSTRRPRYRSRTGSLNRLMAKRAYLVREMRRPNRLQAFVELLDLAMPLKEVLDQFDPITGQRRRPVESVTVTTPAFPAVRLSAPLDDETAADEPTVIDEPEQEPS